MMTARMLAAADGKGARPGLSLGSERSESWPVSGCSSVREEREMKNEEKEWATDYQDGRGDYCLQIQVHWADGGVFTALDETPISRGWMLPAGCRGDATSCEGMYVRSLTVASADVQYSHKSCRRSNSCSCYCCKRHHTVLCYRINLCSLRTKAQPWMSPEWTGVSPLSTIQKAGASFV